MAPTYPLQLTIGLFVLGFLAGCARPSAAPILRTQPTQAEALQSPEPDIGDPSALDAEPLPSSETQLERAELPESELEADPEGPTPPARPAPSAPPQPRVFTFPFSAAALADYGAGIRAFGSCRDNCNRRHAAADLYANTGTGIRSVGDGVIIDYYEFYLGTWALVVDHGTFIVRYGEINRNLPQGVTVGTRVTRGQTIAFVGRLVGLNQDMLHFERYTGTATGPLTVPGNAPYQRRRDLVNPTNDLRAWRYPQ